MVSKFAAGVLIAASLFHVAVVDAAKPTSAEDIKKALETNGLDISKLPPTTGYEIVTDGRINTGPQHCNLLVRWPSLTLVVMLNASL
jgi:hypothetical protein